MHTVSQHKSTLGVSISDLNGQSFPAFDDIRRTVGVLVDEVLYVSHWNCQVNFDFLLNNCLECSENTAGSMLVQEHIFHSSSCLNIQSSGVETNTFSNVCYILVRLRVSVIGDVDERGSIFASSSNCMHQSKTLLYKLLSFNNSEFQSVLFSQLLSLFLKELRDTLLIASPVCPFFSLTLSLS